MTKNLKRLAIYYIYLLFFWGSFRFFVRLPEVVEELWFKPLIWLVPLFWWRLSMKKARNLFEGETLPAIGYGLLGGVIYFGLLRLFAGLNFSLSLEVWGIALVTAIVEEVAFSGVILSVIYGETKREGVALAVMGLAFALVHLPVNIFVRQLPVVPLVGAFLLAFFVALINGFLRLRSNNVLSAIIAHLIFLSLVLS